MPEFILASGVEDELWAIWEHIAGDNPEAATRAIEAARMPSTSTLNAGRTDGLTEANEGNEEKTAGPNPTFVSFVCFCEIFILRLLPVQFRRG